MYIIETTSSSELTSSFQQNGQSVQNQANQLSYLIIAQDPEVSDQLVQSLQQLAVPIEQIHIVSEIHQLINGGHYDVVFYKLPDKIGKVQSTLEIITSTYPEAGVLAISSIMDVEVVERVIESGAHDLLLTSDLQPGPVSKSIITSRIRKHQLSRLMDSASEYEFFFTSDPNPVFIYDLDTLRIVKVNKAACDKYGYSREEFIGLSLVDIRPEKDLEGFMERVNLFRTGEDTSSMGYVNHRSKSGLVFQVELHSRRLQKDSQNLVLCRVQDVSVALQREATLKSNKERFELLTRATSDLVFDWDVKENRIEWGLSIMEKYGYSRDLSIKEWTGLIHPEDQHTYLTFYDTLLSNRSDFKKNWSHQYRIRTLSGAYRDVIENGIAIRSGREVVRIICAIEDITERKLSCEVLKSSEERYNLLFLNSPIPKWVVDERSLQIVEVNNCAIQRLGYSRQEFLEMNLADLGMAEDRLRGQLELLKDSDHSIEIGVFTQQTKTGKELYVQAHAHWLEVSKKRIFIIACQDMTSLFESKNALHESNERYKYAIKATSDVIWDLDLLTNRLHIADNFQVLFGHEQRLEDLNMQLWEEMIHPEDVERVIKSLEAALSNGTNYWEENYRFRKADGTYAHVTDKGHILRTKEGTGYRMIGAMQDKTKHREVEDRLHRSNFMAKLGHWEMNMVTGNLYWSEMTRVIHGVSEDYIPQLENAIEFYKEEESRNRIRENCEATIAGELAGWEEEAIIITSSGQEKWVRAIGEGEFVDGKCIRIFGSFQDITERKEIELQLKAQNLKYELAMNTRSIGVWDWDLKNNTIDWDGTMFELFGISKTDNIKNEYALWYNSLHPEDRVRCHQQVQEAIKNKTNLNFSFRILFKDQSVHHIKAHGQILTDHNNEPYRMVGINYDFTEEVIHQQELEMAQQERDEILESITDGFFAVDSEWKVTYWNKAAEKILDIPKDEICNSKLSVLFSSIKSLTDFEQLKGKIDPDKVYSFEQFLFACNKWISVTVYPKNEGWSVFFKDISEQKFHVDQLLENTLRSQEQERNRIARELHDGVVQQMAACSIHANYIRGLIEKPEKCKEKMIELIDLLQNATTETRNLSHNLHSPEIEKYDLFELLESLTHQLNSLEKTQFHFITEKLEKIAFSDLEKINLYRVIQELSNNILKHAHADNGWIKFRDSEEGIRIDVIDDGKGMNPTRLKSSGIGMKNIKDRINKIGGTIGFENPEELRGLSVVILLNKEHA